MVPAISWIYSAHPLLLASYFFLVGSFQVAADVREVLDTFRVAAMLGSDSFGAYVISMASNVNISCPKFSAQNSLLLPTEVHHWVLKLHNEGQRLSFF